MRGVRVVVPRRADGGRRDVLWAYVERWWAENHPDWPLVVGEHLDGPFNRGGAINRAAAEPGDWDVLLIADADVVADPVQVTAAVDRARRTGRCTLAYDRYVGLSDKMTAKVLAGFDERFAGWGPEDLAFHAACNVLGGGVDRVPGTVWHLWHPISPERNSRSPLLRAAHVLANRYLAADTPESMRALIVERDQLDAVCLVVVTDGRRCIAETVPMAEKMLTGMPIAVRVICDDSGDPAHRAWLAEEFPGYELRYGARREGFAANTGRARQAALDSGLPWCVHLEDDFLLEREVDLAAMAVVMRANPHVVQMALRRQAWTPREIAVGGVVEQHPERYGDHRDGAGNEWLEHTLFWTTNPHLVARETLAAYEWPDRAGSEALFGRRVLRDGRVSGYWGARCNEPWVTHVGAERVGCGY